MILIYHRPLFFMPFSASNLLSNHRRLLKIFIQAINQLEIRPGNTNMIRVMQLLALHTLFIDESPVRAAKVLDKCIECAVDVLVRDHFDACMLATDGVLIDHDVILARAADRCFSLFQGEAFDHNTVYQ